MTQLVLFRCTVSVVFGELWQLEIFSLNRGFLYGHGFTPLLVQLLGVLAVSAWVLSSSFVLFKIIKGTVGLRVTRDYEEVGLDRGEHATSAYSDFMFQPEQLGIENKMVE
jgi:ammonia channel protein AmtB